MTEKRRLYLPSIVMIYDDSDGTTEITLDHFVDLILQKQVFAETSSNNEGL